MAAQSHTEARARRFAALASALVILAGCTAGPASTGSAAGSEVASGPPELANLPDLRLKNVTTETAQARAATIGPDGGTVDAVANDGTTYSLAIPAGALGKPTQVAMYPVAQVAGLPGGSQLFAAVQFAPDGLQLEVPATLSVGLRTAQDPKLVHGLAWRADAAEFHAYPAKISGTTATLVVNHFSGAGLGNPPLVAINTCSSQSEMEAAIADAINAATAGSSGARDQFSETLKLCYANFVKDQLLRGALIVGPNDIEQAATTRIAYDTWFTGISFWAASLFPGFTLTPELADSKVLAAKFLRSWFDTSNATCFIDGASNLEHAVYDASNAVALPHHWAPVWGIESRANRLDYETLLTDACVHVVIDPSRGFSGSTPGAAGTVAVPVGYSFNNQPVVHDMAIHVKLTKTGDQASFAEGDAPTDGRYTASYVWPATVNPLRIDVLASFVDYPVLAVFDRITKHPGSKLALSVSGGNQIRIEVMGEDGSNLRPVTSGPRDLQPTWSPDGTRIAFVRQTTGASSTTSIQVVNADGSGLTALTSGPADLSPAWAPDGSRIAFLRGAASGPFPTIVLMSADGTNVVNTGVTASGGLSWSPDSRQIVYWRLDDQAGAQTTPFRLYVLTVAGGGTSKLGTHDCEPYGALIPDWSATNTIGFYCVTHGNPNGSTWIATVSPTGAGYRAVTGNLIAKQPIYDLTWSPDGTKLAIAEGSGIAVVDTTPGGTATSLGRTGGTVIALDWGP